MRSMWSSAASLAALGVAGCAGLQFNDGPRPGALTYFEPAPYLLVTVTGDCVSAASVLTFPGAPRSVSFHNGYGSASLSVTLSAAGTITTVGQTTDSQIPATLSAVAGLATAAAPLALSRAPGATPQPKSCAPSATLYPFLANGRPDIGDPVRVPLNPR